MKIERASVLFVFLNPFIYSSMAYFDISYPNLVGNLFGRPLVNFDMLQAFKFNPGGYGGAFDDTFLTFHRHLLGVMGIPSREEWGYFLRLDCRTSIFNLQHKFHGGEPCGVLQPDQEQ